MSSFSSRHTPPSRSSLQQLLREIVEATAEDDAKGSAGGTSRRDSRISGLARSTEDRTDEQRFGDLLRFAVKGLSAYGDLSIPTIEHYLGRQIGVAQTSIPRYYEGKGRIDLRVIKLFLAFGARSTFLSREWGRALLEAAHYARYGDPTELLDEHWPPEGLPQRPPRIFSNLPGPSCQKFVMRQELYREILERLQAQSPAVVLVGLAGSGKTTLALEIARVCVSRGSDSIDAAGRVVFDAGVWVSDKDHQGKTNLRTVLETIATALDFPELTRLDRERLKHEVGQILRGRRVLLVIDNLETIGDPQLLDWLCLLPEGSKALVTTRVFPQPFENRGPIKVEVGRLSELESHEFIAVASQAQRLVKPPDPATQRQLIEATGGNPLAIQMLLSLMRASGQPLAKVLELSRETRGRDIGALIQAHWSLLELEARRVLAALTLFSPGATDEALREVAGVTLETYVSVITTLESAALIETTADTADGAGPQRRSLHPLVRQFTAVRLAEDDTLAVELAARRTAWAVDYARAYGGFRPNQPEALAAIGAEEPNLWETWSAAARDGDDHLVVELAHLLEYFYYTRARWQRNRELYQSLIVSARRRGDPADLVNALALYIQLMSRQGQPEAAQEQLSELQQLQHGTTLSGDNFFRAHHARALASFAAGALRDAAAAWQTIVDEAGPRAIRPQLVAGTLHWLALCRQRQGEPTEARTLMEQSLATALEQGNLRRAARNEIALAAFALDAGETEEATRQLAQAQGHDPEPDPEQLAHYLHALGRLHQQQGLVAETHTSLLRAMHLFERMGMEPEKAEVGRLLTALG